MALVDATVWGCLGFGPPQDVQVRIIAPHWHPDHIAPESIQAHRDLGYQVTQIVIHDSDLARYRRLPQYMWAERPNPQYTAADWAVADIMHGGDCSTALRTYTTEIGTAWVRLRGGHTPDSVDLVLDVLGDSTDRVLISGSAPNNRCPPLPGQRLTIQAHGNVILN